MARIRITDENGKESKLDLDVDALVRIGRSDHNEITLHDPSLSRKHAEVYKENGIWMLRDCGSRNGTFVNGQRLTASVTLQPGLPIILGSCRVIMEGAAPAARPPVVDTVTFDDRPLSTEGTVMLKAADAMLMSSPATADPQSFDVELKKIRKRMEIVERGNLELLAHEPMDVLLPKILDLVFEAVKPERAALLGREEDGELVCRAYRGKGSKQQLEISRTIANTVIDQQVSVLTSDALADERFASGASIVAQGIQSVMAAPLWNKKKVIGLIYADSRLTSGLFDDEDLRVLTMLANVAAVQIENASLFSEQLEKQRFEREAQAAAEIQERLLPRERPEIPGYLFESRSTPCYECGGDYFDCLDLVNGRTGIVLVDVAGKGMGAAMLMAVIQATLRARANTGRTRKDLVDQLGTAIARSAPSNRYATLFFMDLDPAKGSLHYVNAGHAPLPILVRPNGEAQELETGGTPLGLFPGTEYPETELQLNPGDFIFGCSDGVTDLENPEGEMFGEERLKELLISLAGQAGGKIRDEVDRQLKAFARDTHQTDDLTYVLLQRKD